MRLRDYDENLPKPMVTIGYRPIMWHLMKYYARFGHKDFILCLGHRADVIKQYFLNYDECLSNDFVLEDGGAKVAILNSDIQDWRITFVDTGANSPIGERLRLVKDHLQGEEIFLANYTDCLTNLDLNVYIERFRESGAAAGLLSVPPSVSLHYLQAGQDGLVTHLTGVQSTPLRVNGGFFVFRQQIFDYLRENEELVDGPFQRLIDDRRLMAYPYDGFWKAMDTFKDKQEFDRIFVSGSPPWEMPAGAAHD
jgi:glucose-1-phosphate cytidylyltransferase